MVRRTRSRLPVGDSGEPRIDEASSSFADFWVRSAQSPLRSEIGMSAVALPVLQLLHAHDLVFSRLFHTAYGHPETHIFCALAGGFDYGRRRPADSRQ